MVAYNLIVNMNVKTVHIMPLKHSDIQEVTCASFNTNDIITFYTVAQFVALNHKAVWHNPASD